MSEDTPPLTHLTSAGEAQMVDVSGKDVTVRRAIATSFVRMSEPTVRALKEGSVAKGDAAAVARIAGIMAAKKTPELIPLCHPLFLDDVRVDVEVVEDGVAITAEVGTTGRTGAEMEALTAASVAALTIYDMCKAIDKGITIENTRLDSKSGGKSGDWRRSP